MADIKFELRGLTNYSNDAIIQEIQRVAAKLNISPLTRDTFTKESKMSSSTASKRFGGWKKALEAAELGHLYESPQVHLKKNKGIGDKELIAELQRIALLHKGKSLTQEIFNRDSQIHAGTIARRLGSWPKALKQAGLEASHLKKYSESEYWENLLLVWAYYGRQPTYGEMSRSPSTINARSYEAKWKTWRKALLTFIDYMNQNPEEQKEAPQEKEIPPPEQKAPLKDKKRPEKQRPENRREISLGLRFKVMYRDHFKCVLCGDNPPATPGLKLHIDHIVPWSKDGKTEIDNLRTLCEACNLGRGNRYID